MAGVKDIDEAPAPLPPSNRTDQRLQHQAIYGMEPLDRLIGVHIRKVQETVATQRDPIVCRRFMHF